MKILDLALWSVGSVQKICKAAGIVKFDLSDGGYTTLGFFTTLLICLLVFITWGVFNV